MVDKYLVSIGVPFSYDSINTFHLLAFEEKEIS